MKRSTEDAWLMAAVFIVWMVLSILYFTVPAIYMPTTGRVWGLGALLFLALVLVTFVAHRAGGRRQGRPGVGAGESAE